MLRRHPTRRHPIRRRPARPTTRRPGLATRLRWSRHRHPWRWWVAVSVLALGSAVAADAHLGSAERACPAPGSGANAVAEVAGGAAAGGAAAERLPAGTRGVAVPAPAGLALAAGDRVDVLATTPAAVEGTDPERPAPVAEVVARAAPVVAADEAAVTVAVAADEAAVVAEAAARAATTLVLTTG